MKPENTPEKESGHTSGKWRAHFSEAHCNWEIKNESGQMFIAQVYGFDADEQRDANAALIARAPELLEENEKLKAELQKVIDALKEAHANYMDRQEQRDFYQDYSEYQKYLIKPYQV